MVDDTYASSAFSAPNGRYEWAGPFCLTSEGESGGGGGGSCASGGGATVCGFVTQISTQVVASADMSGDTITYQLGLDLSGSAKNVYTVFGDAFGSLQMPGAYHTTSAFGANVGGSQSKIHMKQPISNI